MTGRWTPVACLLLLLGSALAVLTPHGASQTDSVGQTSVDLTLPTLPLTPPGTTQKFNVSVRYQWQNGFSHEPTTLRLEVVDQPPWLDSSFQPDTLEIETARQGVSGINVTTVLLNMSVAPDAPAYQEGTTTYRIVAEENGMLQSAEKEVEFGLTPGFSGEIDVRQPRGQNVTAWGGFVTQVPLVIENRGNGPMLLEFIVDLQPAEAVVTVPQDLQLGVEGDARQITAIVEVQVPWKVSVTGEVEIDVIPTHAERGTRGEVATATFFLDGKSAVPVPGPGPWVVLALAGAALLVARGPGLGRGRT